ncbi:MAG: helix-turn-helix transcriptional regulator [Oscillospiraceae bacterium]|nr:MAG: helix-turn-helix transcriptional regulator [Oscillospiraceae bacterium]
MAQRSIQGDQELGRKIKHRRNELNLTIEEAASRAGVGTKTWSRYEAGESIRRDKCKGICKALNWRDFPDGKSDAEKKSLIEEYRDHEAWSQFLADNYGPGAAMAFAIGSDILLDYINQDQSDLASMPSGSHIGQLNTSFISGELPPQFLMRYDYEFLYNMKCVLLKLRRQAKHGMPIIAHSILEELIIYLCNEEAQAFIEIGAGADELIDNEHLNNSKDWVFDMFDDMDIITFLYSNVYLTEDLPFHFEHWSDQQFYMG